MERRKLEIEPLLRKSVDRRRKLIAHRETTNGFRLLAGGGEGIPGLTIDLFDRVAIFQKYLGQCTLSDDHLTQIGRYYAESIGVESVYLKNFAVDRSQELSEDRHYNPTPFWGKPCPEEFVTVENSVQFLIRPYAGYSVGLFLDQRENRKLLGEIAVKSRVLNCFAYTCGFSVYAALNGAEVWSVDASKKYLDWGRRNFEINSIDPAQHHVVQEDVLTFLERLRKRQQLFNLVILDPPSFGRADGKTFSIMKDLDTVISAALKVLIPGGHLFVSANHSELTSEMLTRKVFGQGPCGALELQVPAAVPTDFEYDAKTLASCLVKLN